MQTIENQGILGKLLEKTRDTGFTYEQITVNGYELVLRIREKKSGLDAIISIHNTSLGPAIGGTRIHPYKTFEKALEDVLRLSKGMTYKSSIAQVGLGGGKSVIIADPKAANKREILLAFGEAVNQLNGFYVCAEDVGCSTEDVKIIAEKTPFVTGLVHEKSSGNPSPFTAWGTFRGIQASLFHLYGTSCLEGKKVLVQGVGSVGEILCDLLYWHGADLIVSDVNKSKLNQVAKKYGAMVVSPERIYQVDCDVFVPCAMGGILSEMTIPSLRCKIIAGAANNQLYCNDNAEQLRKRGILYAPDFVINAGGLYNVSEEVSSLGYDPKIARKKTDNIYNTLLAVFDIAKANDQSTHHAAMDLSDYRVKYGIGKRVTPLSFHLKAK